MLKSASLCLYSSNLGTFWLKIEQFWPFEEISIFSNSAMEGRAVGHNFERAFWLTLKQQWTIKISSLSSPLFSILSLAAILVGSQDQRTQFWKRAIQIPFHQSLVAIGPVVSEEKIKVYDVRQTDRRRRTPSDGKSSHGLWPGELKRGPHQSVSLI